MLFVGAAEAIDVTTAGAVDIPDKPGKESHHNRLQLLARFQRAKILLVFRSLFFKVFCDFVEKNLEQPQI